MRLFFWNRKHGYVLYVLQGLFFGFGRNQNSRLLGTVSDIHWICVLQRRLQHDGAHDHYWHHYRYKLVNCDNGGSTGCSLGPIVFNLRLFAHGDATVTLQPLGTVADFVGTDTSFKGTVIVAPEPISLVLTGTGLVGVWIQKKTAQAK
jgi:hypothetical protein